MSPSLIETNIKCTCNTACCTKQDWLYAQNMLQIIFIWWKEMQTVHMEFTRNDLDRYLERRGHNSTKCWLTSTKNWKKIYEMKLDLSKEVQLPPDPTPETIPCNWNKYLKICLTTTPKVAYLTHLLLPLSHQKGIHCLWYDLLM